MNETTKTAIFLTLAVVLVAVAFVARPVVREIKPDEMIDKALFPEFDDPLKIKTLEIVRLDSTGDPVEFRIAEVDDTWSIPSHGNYPADAKEQMGKVAAALIDLKVHEVKKLDEAADKTTLHAMYGVIDPTSDAASLGEGIGVKVKLGGSGDKTLVDLIIGKETNPREKKSVDDPDEKGNLRYVRITGQTPVYVVEIDPERFSTSFDQWIERNLLDINTLDLKQIFIDEDSLKIEFVERSTGGGLALQKVPVLGLVGDMLLGYNGSAVGAEKWKLEQATRFDKKSDKYVDAPMQPDEELNIEVLDAMVSALNDLKIVSVTKKPSVLAAALKSGEALETIEPDPSLEAAGFYLVKMLDRKGGTTGGRVQLRSNEGDLQLRMKDGIRYNLRFGKLTGTESEIDESEGGKDATKPKDEPTMGANRYIFITAEFDSSVIPPPDIKEVPEVPTEGEAADIEKAKVEKERIEKSNQREEDRYKAAIEAGQGRVKELTDRFADWYYVIPEDVYKKVHIGLADIVREKKQDAHEHGNDDDGDEDDEPVKTFPTLPGMDGLLTIPNLDETRKTGEPMNEEPESDKAEPTNKTEDEMEGDTFDPFRGEPPK